MKIYGRDAWDGQLLSTIWTFLWYRDEAPTLTFSRLQQVEHEAFVTLLAERAAVPVSRSWPRDPSPTTPCSWSRS